MLPRWINFLLLYTRKSRTLSYPLYGSETSVPVSGTTGSVNRDITLGRQVFNAYCRHERILVYTNHNNTAYMKQTGMPHDRDFHLDGIDYWLGVERLSEITSADSFTLRLSYIDLDKYYNVREFGDFKLDAKDGFCVSMSPDPENLDDACFAAMN